MIDIEEYTKDEALKNLIAVETHLEKFGSDPIFCRECLTKHLAYLELLSEECIAGNCNPKGFYDSMRPWAYNLRKSLDSLTSDNVKKFLKETRDFRKQVEQISSQPKRKHITE